MKNFIRICCPIILLLVLPGTRSYSQQYLEKRISLKAINEPLDKVLDKISDLGGFSFSYSPDLIDVRRTVSIQVSSAPVREILDELFKGKATFKERRRYIIIQKASVPQENKAPENFHLNGYITDYRTGEKLANASIYEPITLASAVSNEYGHYRIRLPTASSSIRLEVRKEEYIGRSIAITGRKDAYLPIVLSPDTLKIIPVSLPQPKSRLDSVYTRVNIPVTGIPPRPAPDTAGSAQQGSQQYDRLRSTYKKVQKDVTIAFASARQAINTRNISDTLHRPFQASVLPFLGTNHHLSGNIVNDYSVNFIAGYALGVDKFEVGAVMNVVRGNVKGFQLAGVSNIVGHDVTGFQYANSLNITLGSVTGFQGSHLINYTGRNLKGVQVAGAGNVVVEVLNGWQISSGYNYAHTVRNGRQIGVINYADSIATVPFGFFSYVRQNGYRRYEVGVNEFNYFNFSFKTGVSRFYNIFTLGFNGLAKDKPLGTIGYGFGTAQYLGRRWTANADLTGSIVLLNGQRTDQIPAVLGTLSVSIEKRLGSRFAFFAGPSLNILGSEYSGILKPGGKIVQPVWLDPAQKGNPQYTWLGFQAGIRFCNVYRL